MSLCYLLAAGEGRRLRPYTEKIIKPRMEFLTLPLSYYGIYLAMHSPFKKILMNKHHLPSQVDKLADEIEVIVESVKTIDETRELLGSGGALWNARHILEKEDHFLIANADEVLLSKDPNLLKNLFKKHLENPSLATLLTCDHPELLKSLKAVWVNDKGEVRGFGMESPEPNLKPVHYTGYKIFPRKILDWLPEGESNIFYDVLVEAISKGEKIQTLHLEDAIWHETGNFTSFLRASHEITRCGWSFVQDRLKFFSKQFLVATEHENGKIIHPQSIAPHTENFRGTVVLNEQVLPDSCLFENAIVHSRAQLQSDGKYKDQMVL